jgi:hypothetical protein
MAMWQALVALSLPLDFQSLHRRDCLFQSTCQPVLDLRHLFVLQDNDTPRIALRLLFTVARSSSILR